MSARRAEARRKARWQSKGAPQQRVIRYERPSLYREQEDAIFHPARYVMVEASTKTGKTTGCASWLVEEAVRDGFDGWMGWWVAPIYKQAAIAYTRIKRWAGDWIESNDSKLEITLPNRARLVFRGGDNPDSLYGDDAHAAVIDEATRCKEGTWIAMRSQLSATGGRVRIIGNVKGSKNWAYKLGRAARGGALNMHYARLTCWHAVAAGIMTVQEVLEAQSQMPDWVFRELYLAEPSDDGSNPFGLGNIEACTVTDAPTVSRMLRSIPVVWGIDLAKSVDWTVAIALNAMGEVCRFERWQAPWRDSLPRIRRLVGSTPALIDSTGVGNPIVEFLQAPTLLTHANPSEVRAALEAASAFVAESKLEAQIAQALAEVSREAPNVVGYGFTQQSKQALMETLAIALQTRMVRFPKGGTGIHAEVLKDELDAFEFEHTRTGVRYSAPEGMHDDAVIALALAVYGYNTQYRARSAGAALITL